MNIENLVPGIYRLTETVENPEADRRSRDIWKWESWKKGLRFVVIKDDELSEVTNRVIFLIKPLLGAHYELRFGRKIPVLPDLLLPYLDLEPESLDSILAVARRPSCGVLERLVETGILSLEDVKGVL